MLDAILRFLSLLLRLAFTLAGVVLAGLMLLIGIGLAVGLIGWSLIRGRRPQLGGLGGFRSFRAGPGFGAGSRAQWRAAPDAGASTRRAPVEVIDIDARVLPESGSRTQDH